MADAHHKEKLSWISQTLLRLAVDSPQDQAFRTKASTTRTLKLLWALWGERIDDAWWERVTDNQGVCIYNETQAADLRALGSFVNHNQNWLGPNTQQRFDITSVDHEAFLDYVTDFDGTVVRYDRELAQTNYQMRRRYDAEMNRFNQSPDTEPALQGSDELRAEYIAKQKAAEDKGVAEKDKSDLARDEEKNIKRWTSQRRETSAYPLLENDIGATA